MRIKNFKPLAKYGRYTILKEIESKPQRRVLCECECGTIKEVRLQHLVTGAIVSCGCWKIEVCSVGRTGVEGKVSNTKLYKVWRGMIERCYSSNHISFGNYGGRGITVCQEWRTKYENFYSWALVLDMEMD